MVLLCAEAGFLCQYVKRPRAYGININQYCLPSTFAACNTTRPAPGGHVIRLPVLQLGWGEVGFFSFLKLWLSRRKLVNSQGTESRYNVSRMLPGVMCATLTSASGHASTAPARCSWQPRVLQEGKITSCHPCPPATMPKRLSPPSPARRDTNLRSRVS